MPWSTQGATDFPAWLPVRVYKADDPERGKNKAGKRYSHRVFFCCMLCGEEVPAGRLGNHFKMESHGAVVHKRRRPISVVMDMLSRRKEKLLGERAAEVSIATSGGQIYIRTRPENIAPARDYLLGLGLRLLAEGPAEREVPYSLPEWPQSAKMQYIFGY